MTAEDNETSIRERIRAAREAATLTQADVAQSLGIEADAYRKYETRSLMPINLLGKFCIATGAELDVIVYGRRRAAPAAATKRNGTASITILRPRADIGAV